MISKSIQLLLRTSNDGLNTNELSTQKFGWPIILCHNATSLLLESIQSTDLSLYKPVIITNIFLEFEEYIV